MMINRSAILKTAINRESVGSWISFAAVTAATVTACAFNAGVERSAVLEGTSATEASVTLKTSFNAVLNGETQTHAAFSLTNPVECALTGESQTFGGFSLPTDKRAAFAVECKAVAGFSFAHRHALQLSGVTGTVGVLDPVVANANSAICDIALRSETNTSGALALTYLMPIALEGSARTQGGVALSYRYSVAFDAKTASVAPIKLSQVYQTSVTGDAQSYGTFLIRLTSPVAITGTMDASYGQITAFRDVGVSLHESVNTYWGLTLKQRQALRFIDEAQSAACFTLNGAFGMALQGKVNSYLSCPLRVCRRISFNGETVTFGTLTGLQLNTEKPATKGRTLIVW